MLCLALQPGQKSGMILPFEVVLKLKLPKNHFNKKFAPKILFLNEKKKSERFLTLKIHFEIPISALCNELAKLGKASQDAYNPGKRLIL